MPDVIQETYERFKHLDGVLSTILDTEGPFHVAARDMWAAIKAYATAKLPDDRRVTLPLHSIDFEECLLILSIDEPTRDKFRWHAGKVEIDLTPITEPV